MEGWPLTLRMELALGPSWIRLHPLHSSSVPLVAWGTKGLLWSEKEATVAGWELKEHMPTPLTVPHLQAVPCLPDSSDVIGAKVESLHPFTKLFLFPPAPSC